MDACLAELPAPAGDADWRLGLALAGAGRWTDAARAYARATRAAPRDSVYWLNRAQALRRGGHPARALAAVQRCLRLDPHDALARRMAAACLAGLGRHAEAVAVCAALEAEGRSDAATRVEQAGSLLALGHAQAACGVLLRALAAEPACVAAHRLLAEAFSDQGLKQEAAECLKTVLALDPADLQARAGLSYLQRQLCDWTDLAGQTERLRQGLEQLPADQATALPVFGLLSLPLDPTLQLKAARAQSLLAAQGVRPLPALDPARRAPGRARVGWVSHDFCDHPVAQLLHPVLADINRERFETVLYSTGPGDASPWRQRLADAADRFVDLRGLTDRQAALRIRADGIDLLIDLMGHTRGQRLGIFAHRPAPVQASYLGFAGSTGADFIDCLIGDAIVTPLALAGQYSETLAQLPLTFQPNGRGRPLPQPMRRAEAGLPDDAFVMCAFHPAYKIQPETFEVWCAVLRQVPHGVLWLRDAPHPLRERMRREAAQRGIAGERIVFAAAVTYAAHFSRLALADVFVDTWPYNGHTTVADALWAGVPVVTRHGESYASRVAASVLNAAGIGELAFAEVEGYQRAILALALDYELREAYRRHLQTQRVALPLFDSERCARELESLFGAMLARWRTGRPCENLPAN